MRSRRTSPTLSRPRRTSGALACALAAAAVAVPSALAASRKRRDTVPPAWRPGAPAEPAEDDAGAPALGMPYHFAVGPFVNIPEITGLEGWGFLGRYLGVRAFVTPPIPFKVRVEMPSDVISTKQQIGIANPDFEVRFHGVYGPNYGLEGMVFPFGGSFFLDFGVSHRTMRLSGSTQSAILICSLLEAAKEPPCPDPEARLKTGTELRLRADATVSALLLRTGAGWFWEVGRHAYFTFSGGLTRPTHVTKSVDIHADVEAPTVDQPEITGALADVRAEREKDLNDKALREMRPVAEKALPIVGVSAGWRF
jgi:hypothetical protein